MTKTNETAEPEMEQAGEHSGHEIEVLVHAAGVDPRKLTTSKNRTIGEFLDEAGHTDALLLVFVGELDGDESPDDAEPIARDLLLAEIILGRILTLHCHHCQKVAVRINYRTKTLEHPFAPNTRVRKVLRWAKRKLELNDADADNLALFLVDGGDQVREGVHLGQLTHAGKCEVCFELSKDVNIEGAK